MAKKAQPLMDFIPDLFRADEVDVNLISQVALANLVQEGASITEQVGFLSGLKAYHALVNDEDKRMFKGGPTQGWRWYSDTITKVERFTRESGGKHLGTKVRIKLSSGEDIDTDWVDFIYADNANDPTIHWQIALGKTIEEIATKAVGKKVSLLKHVYAGTGGKGARTVINMRVNYNQDDAADVVVIDKVTIKGGRRIINDLDIKSDDDFEALMSEIINGINDGDITTFEIVNTMVKGLLDSKVDIKPSKDDVEVWDQYEDSGLGVQLMAYGISLLDSNWA